MKLARSRTAAGIVPVVEVDNRWYDLTPIAADVGPTVVALDFQGRIRSAVDANAVPAIDAPAEYAAPLSGIGKIVCIGLNYRDHAEETGATPPAEPVIFMKAPDTVAVSYTHLTLPTKRIV